MKFLIDECLSPDLVAVARNRGFPQSTHVNWLGLTSRKDWTIVQCAIENGYVLVTNNTTDFTSLVERQDVHAGLVCLNAASGLMSLEAQKVLFEQALDELAGKEPVNEVVEITLTDDRSVKTDRYDCPPESREESELHHDEPDDLQRIRGPYRIR